MKWCQAAVQSFGMAARASVHKPIPHDKWELILQVFCVISVGNEAPTSVLIRLSIVGSSVPHAVMWCTGGMLTHSQNNISSCILSVYRHPSGWTWKTWTSRSSCESFFSLLTYQDQIFVHIWCYIIELRCTSLSLGCRTRWIRCKWFDYGAQSKPCFWFNIGKNILEMWLCTGTTGTWRTSGWNGKRWCACEYTTTNSEVSVRWWHRCGNINVSSNCNCTKLKPFSLISMFEASPQMISTIVHRYCQKCIHINRVSINRKRLGRERKKNV